MKAIEQDFHEMRLIMMSQIQNGSNIKAYG